MSRYHKTIPSYDHSGQTVEATLAYGFDHVAGYFYQVYVPTQQSPVEDRDSWRKLSRGEMLERIDELNVQLPDEHRAAISLDLPF